MRLLLLYLLLLSALTTRAQSTYWARAISGVPLSAQLMDGPVVGPDGRVTTVMNAQDTVRVGTTLLVPDPALKANNTFGFPARNSDTWLLMHSASGRLLHVVRATQHRGAWQSIVQGDSAGNLYWAGTFHTSIRLGTVQLQAANPARWDSFLCKLDSAGNVLWARTLGATKLQGDPDNDTRNLRFLRVDGAGNVYLGGDFQGANTVAGTALATDPLYADSDLFMASFTPSGQARWVRQYGATGWPESIKGLDVLPNGQLYLSFRYRSTTTMGPYSLNYSNGASYSYGVAVAKCAATGAPLWLRGLDTPGNDVAFGITALAAGGCAVQAYVAQATTQLGPNLPSNAYLIRFSTAGALLWATPFSPSFIGGLASDAAGNVYVGATVGSAALNAGNGVVLPASATGNAVPCIVSFGANGQAQWAVQGASVSRPGLAPAFPVNGVSVSPNGDVHGLAIGAFAVALGRDTVRSAYEARDAGYYALWKVRPPLAAGSVGAAALKTCPGAQFAVPFTAGPGVPTGNVFTAQLSDSLGAFDQPVAVGSLAGTSSGTIPVTLPASVAAADGYRLRVVASAPRATASSGAGVPVRVYPGTYVALASTTPVAVCEDAPPIALRGEGGVGTALQWLRNGQPLPGATAATYTPTQSGTYALQATGSCGTAVSAAVPYTVLPLPTAALAPLGTVTISQPPFALSGGTPAGGVYSGPGVANNVFSPQAAGVGTHRITYTYTNSDGCTAAAIATLQVQTTLATHTSRGSALLHLYPNPSNGLVQLRWAGRVEQVELQLRSAAGQLVRRDQVQLIPGEHVVDCRGLPAGVYRLQVQRANGVLTVPLVLQP